MKNFFKRFEVIDYAFKNKQIKKVVDLDFNYSVGDTIKEKYQSLQTDLCMHTRNELYDNVDDDKFFWIWCSPEISCIFETATNNIWKPLTSLEWEFTQRDREENRPHLIGGFRVLYDRWYVVKDASAPKDTIYCGCTSVFKDPYERYNACEVKYHNFII